MDNYIVRFPGYITPNFVRFRLVNMYVVVERKCGELQPCYSYSFKVTVHQILWLHSHGGLQFINPCHAE